MSAIQLEHVDPDGGDEEEVTTIDLEEPISNTKDIIDKVKKPTSPKKSNRLNRLTLQERIKIVRLYSIYKLPNLVQKVWKQNLSSNTETDFQDPPSRKTIVAINRKFDQTGAIADSKRTGRPKTSRSDENIEKVLLAIQQDPRKSVRGIAKEVGLNKATVHRIMQERDKQQKQLKIENDVLREKINELEKRLQQYEGKKTIVVVNPSIPATTMITNSKIASKRTAKTTSSISKKSKIKKYDSEAIFEIVDNDNGHTQIEVPQSKNVVLDVPSPATRNVQFIPIEDSATSLTDSDNGSQVGNPSCASGSETLVFNIQGPDSEGLGTAELILPYSESRVTVDHNHGQIEQESKIIQVHDTKVKTKIAEDGTITTVLEMMPTQSWRNSAA